MAETTPPVSNFFKTGDWSYSGPNVPELVGEIAGWAHSCTRKYWKWKDKLELLAEFQPKEFWKYHRLYSNKFAYRLRMVNDFWGPTKADQCVWGMISTKIVHDGQNGWSLMTNRQMTDYANYWAKKGPSSKDRVYTTKGKRSNRFKHWWRW